MWFIDSASDNVMTADGKCIDFANQYMTRLAANCGVDESEMRTTPTAFVRRLCEVLALREMASSLLGSDSTAYMDGINTEDIYYRKYKMYADIAKQMESGLSYSDFAFSDADSSGKGGVGVIRLSRG